MNKNIKPGSTQIKLGCAGETLRVHLYDDGTAALTVQASRVGFDVSLSADEVAELRAALSPAAAALIETLDMLACAADALVPSAMISGPLTGEERECRDRIRDARELLKGYE